MPRPGQQPRLQLRRKGADGQWCARNSTSERMQRVKNAGGVPDGKVKVQLDARTVVTVNSAKALDFWRGRYPELRIINA